MEDKPWRGVVFWGKAKGSPEPRQFLIWDGTSYFLPAAHLFFFTHIFFHLSSWTVGQYMCFSIHLVTNFNNTGGFRFSAALETKQSHVTSVDLNFWFIESSLLLWLLTSGPLSSPLEALFSPLPGGGRTTGFLEVLGVKTFYHPSNPFPVIGLFGRYMLGEVGCLRHSRLLSLHTRDLPLILEGCSFLDLLRTEP